MSWETKTIKLLDEQFNNDDTLKQTWSITRKVNEAENKKYARELCRTVHYTKDGQEKSFPVTLTAADVNWVLANGEAIKAALKPTPKVAETAKVVEGTIEEVPF